MARVRWPLWRRILQAMLVSAVLLLPALIAPGGARAQQPDPDLDRLRQLVVRLLGQSGVTPDGRPITADILLGDLPADAPIPLLVPPGGRVVGSVLRRAGDDIVGVTAALDVPGTAETIVGFYERELPVRGFRPLPTGFAVQGGFQPTGQPSFRSFCGAPSGPFLNVTIATPPSGPSEVRINGDTLSEGPCGVSGGLAPGFPDGTPLPLLTPPSGVVVQLGGPFIFGGPPMPGNRLVSEATALTDFGVAELEATFAAQLGAAGWTRLAGDADAVLAWSRWQVPGEEGRVGFLYVLTGPGPGQRTLHLDAVTAAPPRRFAAGFRARAACRCRGARRRPRQR